MKKIEAFIRHEAFEPIRLDLLEKGFPSLSVGQYRGSGRQKGITEHYRGSELTIHLRPKMKLEIVVADSDVGLVTETILKHARSGEVGDGKIFVLPVEDWLGTRPEFEIAVRRGLPCGAAMLEQVSHALEAAVYADPVGRGDSSYMALSFAR